MSANRLPFVLATACFISFGWGMLRHFRRSGKLSRKTQATGVLALVCAAAQMTALWRLEIQRPTAASLLYVASLALFWSSVRVSSRKLAACGQPHVNAGILRDGPFGKIRHPFYASYDLAWTAGFVATGWWPLAAGALLMASVYDRFACEEETGFFRSSLQSEYLRYWSTTGKYVPRLL